MLVACSADGTRRAGLPVAAGPRASEPRRSPCKPDEIHIPAGLIRLGTPGSESAADLDRTVELAAFCIDQTEVTVSQYDLCVADGACEAPLHQNVPTGDTPEELECNDRKGDRGNYPINCVDWVLSDTYCGWLGARLPTVDEWEYAARGDSRIYPWGNTPPHGESNMCGSECKSLLVRDHRFPAGAAYDIDDGWPTTAPVGSFPLDRSPFGVMDTDGNVGEWTASEFPGFLGYKLMKGAGWWAQDAQFGNLAMTTPYLETLRSADRGFRCARSLANQ